MLGYKYAARIAKLFDWTKEDAESAIKDFVERFGESQFQETRLELIKICILERNPQTRWERAREYLLNRLETQIPDSNPKDPFTKFLILSHILDKHSFIGECIKCVALFNVEQIKLPKGLIIRIAKVGRFFDWVLGFPSLMGELEVKFKDGTTKKAMVPKNEFDSDIMVRKLNPIAEKAIRECFSASTDAKGVVTEWKEILKHKKSLSHVKKQTGIDLKKEPYWIFESPLLTKYFRKSSKIIDWKYNLFPKIKPKVPLTNVETLNIELADLYVDTLKPSQRKDVLLQGIKEMGYKVFKLNTLHEILNEWERTNHYEIVEHALETLLNAYSPTARKKNDTKKKQTLFYVKVSELEDKGMSIREASKEVGVELGVKPGYVRKQYYEIKNENIKMGYSLSQIKDKYGWD